MNKKIIICGIIVGILIIGIFLFVKTNVLINLDNTKTENETSEVTKFNIASIQYSISGDESDSGKIVIYDLYSNNNKTYDYIQKVYVITIAGKKEVSSTNGKINSKEDLLKIDNNFKKQIQDSNNSEEKHLNTHYTYLYSNGSNEEVDTIEEMIKKLF